ncbi:MAG TPA: hypothetical protein PK668_11340 [Myxococcota bacterium]|nr:hypothetical protein [Myxococcota bacterium]HRY93240.1 hypothetical protein [Myxococcota bacterium]HSA20686.1 hypothetical protein [Myxococcota bacterium]
MTRYLSALLCLCVGSGLPCLAAAQEGAPLSVLLKPSGPRSQHAQACELTLQRSLLQAGLEVLAPPGVGQEGAATGASLIIGYQLLEQADGGRRSFKLSLEARVSATSQLAGSVVETSAPFASGPGQAMRALEEVCEAGGRASRSSCRATSRPPPRTEAPSGSWPRTGPEACPWC